MNRPIRGKTLNLVTDLPQNTFILRFDDGPGLFTEPLLNMLAVAQLRSFFCVTGEMARKNPQVIRRAFLEGHIIVNHSESHKKSFSLLSRKKLHNQILETQKLLQEITGTTPLFFAAPMGHGNLFLKKILKENNLLLLGWDINARDAFNITKKTKEKLIKKIDKSEPQQIILLHDNSYASFKNRQNFLSLVETVISHIV